MKKKKIMHIISKGLPSLFLVNTQVKIAPSKEWDLSKVEIKAYLFLGLLLL